MKISRVRQETPDIVSLELCAADNDLSLPPFEPGAHIDLHLAPRLVRQYSLHTPYSERGTYEIAVLKDPNSRGGSLKAHELKENDFIEIGGPRNLFPLDPSGSRYILMAGGIGITPLLCMAQSLAANGRDFTLHYFTRTLETVAFHDILSTGVMKDATFLHLIEDDPGSFFDAARDLPDYVDGLGVYICGPIGFIEAVREAARDRGYPEFSIHFESFAAPEPHVETGDEAFEVELESTGQIFAIPVGKTIAQVLLEAGIDIEVSCEQGMCGTCLVDLIEGQVEHRDIYQTESEKAENQRVALCCSRGHGRIVIDP